MEHELSMDLSFEWNLERIIDDFILLCFLIGNDFLPHIPFLKITEGGIDCLLMIYKLTMPNSNDYLTNNGILNLNEF